MKTSFGLILSLFTLLIASVIGGTSPEGIKFLDAKRAEEGVVETASGLMYKEIRPGTGKTPTVNSPCLCHYAGTLIDGTEFDSSYKRGQPCTYRPLAWMNGCLHSPRVRLCELSYSLSHSLLQ